MQHSIRRWLAEVRSEVRWIQLIQKLDNRAGLSQVLIDIIGLEMECRNQTTRVQLVAASAERCATWHWIYLEIPVWTRTVEIDENFLVVEPEFFEGNLRE